MALLFPSLLPHLSPLAELAFAPPHAPALPAVEETAGGWLVQHTIPGHGAGDVTVEVHKSPRGVSTLKLLVEPHGRHALRLPPTADAHGITASVLHGVLRVAVPRRAPVQRSVPVADAAAAPEKEEDEAEVVSVSLPVPGLSAEEARARCPPARCCLPSCVIAPRAAAARRGLSRRCPRPWSILAPRCVRCSGRGGPAPDRSGTFSHFLPGRAGRCAALHLALQPAGPGRLSGTAR
jgi:hypothetical protein